MTRELKFRAWDSRRKKMVESGFYIIRECTVFEMLRQHFEPMDGLTSVERLNDCVVMQYTGLHDKHGKEIYEGDVVRMSLAFNDGLVIFRAVIELQTGGFWFRGVDYPLTDCNWHHYNDEDMEVIGNIWEQPDLLKGAAP